MNLTNLSTLLKLREFEIHGNRGTKTHRASVSRASRCVGLFQMAFKIYAMLRLRGENQIGHCDYTEQKTNRASANAKSDNSII